MNKINQIILCLFLSINMLVDICSQTEISFNHIGISEGLNDLTVNAIAQDSLGLLYFGTENGLNIYDGSHFESYYSQNKTQSISENTINVLLADSKNRIWIGNSKCLDLYTRNNNTIVSYKVRAKDFGIQSVYEAKNGKIWIGTFGAGLQYFDEKSKSIMDADYAPLINSSIASIAEDIWGNIWIGTEFLGLFYLDFSTKKLSCFNDGIVGVSKPYDFRSVRIRTLCPDEKGNMFVGTYDNGLFWYSREDKGFNRLSLVKCELNDNSKITAIKPDKNGNYWISTDGDGIFIYRTTEKTIMRIRNTDDPGHNLSSLSIRTIFIDKDNTFWAGTYKCGLNYSYQLNKNSFVNYNKGLDNKNISSLLQRDKNTLFVGTDGGGIFLFDLNNKKFEDITKSTGINAKNILCIHKDYKSNFWIGTYDQGLFQMNSNLKVIGQFTERTDELNNNDIRSIASDSTTIYICTNGGGLNIYNQITHKFKYNIIDYMTHDSDIVYNFTGPTLIDSRGNLWIGTFFGITIVRAKTGVIINLSPKDNINIKSFYINCIFEDSNGYIWFGTNEGLSRLNRSVWELEDNFPGYTGKAEIFKFTNYLYNENDALIVNSILDDNFGNLWLGTNRGLIRFGINKEQPKQFYSETGINMQLFNVRAACKLKDGTMLFGGNNGFVSFLPDSLSELSLFVRPILTKFYINLKEINCGDVFNNDVILSEHINYTKKIRLKHTSRIFSIAFGTTNTFLPEEIQYAYMLTHFDDDWNYPEKNNKIATYSNLNPGKYIFKLKARYNNSDWNSITRELEIEILPPFYKTWLFRTGVMLFIIAILYLIYLQRIASLKKLNIRLEQQVTIKSKLLLEEKEAKLVELDRNKTLQIEKEAAEKEKLRIEKDMQIAQNGKLTAELNLINEKENSIKAELSASLAQISKTNDLLEGLKKELNQIISLKEEEIQNKLRQIIQKIDSETYFKDDWHKFETHFNVVYNDFMKRIKTDYPDLTRKDLRLCSYMRMNLSSNEIAQLSNITLRGVEKSRSRLRKKLNLLPEADLSDYILNY